MTKLCKITLQTMLVADLLKSTTSVVPLKIGPLYVMPKIFLLSGHTLKTNVKIFGLILILSTNLFSLPVIIPRNVFIV